MQIQEYVTAEEVKKVCNELNFRDWSELKKATVTKEEASKILNIINTKGMDIPLDDFQQGMEVELEHGTRYEDANVTNNHPILTGKIVLAHLKETIDYYKRIAVAEIEGDLLRAILSKNVGEIESKYKKLIQAKKALNKAVEDQIIDRIERPEDAFFDPDKMTPEEIEECTHSLLRDRSFGC